MRTLLLDAVALLVYPGLLTAGVAGVIAEWVQARAGEGPNRRLRAILRPLIARPPATAIAAAAVGALAAAQVSAPFSPLDPIDRNVLVAVVCGAAIAWLGWAWAPREAGLLVLAGVGGWALAALVPAVLAQDLHPQVLAGLALRAATPAKVAAAVLYVVSVPAMLGGLAPAALTQRLWLWLPAGGLFASVFAPGGGDDLLGLLRFFAVTGLVVLVAIGLGRVVAGRLYPLLILALSAAASLLAVIAAFVH